jgi:hypothetical protein
LEQAADKLNEFAFCDVVENPQLFERIGTWLGEPLAYAHVNATSQMPQLLRRPLHGELTQAVYEQLESLSRLDIELWMQLARQSMGGAGINRLVEQTRTEHIARYAKLMA